MIEIRELTCGRTGQAGPALTCSVARAECVLLSGPPAQASLWLSAIAGMAHAGSGRIHLEGRDVTLLPLTRRRLTFRASAAMAVLPVTVDEYLRLAGAGRAGAGRVDPAALAHLSSLRCDQRVDTLDAAAVQTLGLAASIASGAAFLLVDAPLATGTGEDHARRRALLTEARHAGRTLLVSGLGSRDPLVDHLVEAGA